MCSLAALQQRHTAAHVHHKSYFNRRVCRHMNYAITFVCVQNIDHILVLALKRNEKNNLC